MGGPLKSIPASQPKRAGTSTGWAWTRLSSLTTANKDTRQSGPTTGSSPPLQSAGSPERGWTSCAPAVYSSPPRQPLRLRPAGTPHRCGRHSRPRALRGERRVHALPRPAHAPSIHRVGMARDRQRRALAGAAGRGGASWPAGPCPLPAAIRHAENPSGGLLPVIFRLLMLLLVVKGGGEPGGGPVRFGRGEG